MGKFFEKNRRDLVGIIYLVAGLLIVLSLASFRPTDPSFNSVGSGLHVHNYVGYFGSFLSDVLFQLWGVSAWLLVAVCAQMAVRNFKNEDASLLTARTVWGFLLLVTAASLLALHMPDRKIYSGQIALGGLVGTLVSRGLVAVFNYAGVAVLLWAVTLVLLVFYTEKPLREIFETPVGWTGSAKEMFEEWMADQKSEAKVARAEMKAKEKELKAKEKEAAKQAKEAAKAQAKLTLVEKPVDGGRAAAVKAAGDDFDRDEDEDDDREDSDDDGNSNVIPIGAGASGSEATPMRVAARRKVVLTAKVQRRIENWKLPELAMLEDPPESRIKIDEKEIRRKGDVLTNKLAQFSVKGEVQGAKPGPAVTMYEFKPNADVKISRITELADDLSLALSSESVRIIAPIPGRDVVGIETSNAQRETVFLKDILANDTFWSDKMKLPLALGRQADGEAKVVDLRKMPHLLVAGTTGSGKSVFVVSAITGLLFRHSPKTLRLILIDPKQVDLAAFGAIPHLLMPPIREAKKAVVALKWAIKEMDKRYRSMSRFGARGLEGYNEIVNKFSKEEIEKHEAANTALEEGMGKLEQYYYTEQPMIVIVVEEFGDLMAVDKVNVEQAVVRLAQMARACGIHLILAMQSPRKDVVTGLIKTNIPGRISFKVASKMDSRIILDDAGAERLLAQGDMLFLAPGVSKPQRHHGAWVTEPEITAIMKFWSDQGEPQFDPLAMRALEGNGGGFEFGSGGEDGGDPLGDGNNEEYDDKYDEVLAWVSAQKEVSASLLQRKFRLGYPRAARMIELFERESVVGPANGSKPRQVLITAYKDA